MNKKEFWRSTIREIKALIDVHIEINDPKAKRKFIDEIL